MKKSREGKYFFVWIVTLIVFCILIAEASAAKNGSYYSYRDKVFKKAYTFKPIKNKIMISFTHEIEPAQMLKTVSDEGLTPIHITEKRHFGVYKLKANASQGAILSNIRKRHGVLAAIPVMIDQEGIERHFIPHEFTVQFKKEVSEEKILKIIDSLGCRIIKKQRTKGYYTLAVPKKKMFSEISQDLNGKALFEIIQAFIAMEEVEFSEPSFFSFNRFSNPFYPDDIEFPGQWNLEDTGQFDYLKDDPNIDTDINAPEAWGIETGDPNVVIVIIDTGMDLNHEDLVGNLLPREGEDWDFSEDISAIPQDHYCHGTCVAGIAAAVTNNEDGVAGIAHGCRIMPLKIWKNDKDIADTINYVIEHAQRHPHFRYVINCSWGINGDSIAVHSAFVNAKNHDIFACVASGNDNVEVSYPAKYPEVIAVGASNPCEERKDPVSCDSEPWGSCYGQELDVVAPGVLLPTTDITGILGYVQGNYFDSFGGTSGACPNVAGLAALLFSHYPSLSVKDVSDTIRLNTKDIESPGWDEETGFGKIDAYKALSNPVSFIRFDLDPNEYSSFNDPNFPVIHHEDAIAMRVHFSSFVTQDANDIVLLKDGNDNSYGNPYYGNPGSFTSHAIPGDTIKINYHDPNGNYGFVIDFYECFVRNVYVDCNASGLEDGTSWENAFTEIQDAIDDPNTVHGSIIWVEEGVYQENIDFKGKNIGLYSLTDPNKTIIDGNGSGSVVSFESGEDYSIISGFTLQDGNSIAGGGIWCYSASSTITNCIIKGNTATYYGGAIYCDSDSSLTITNSTISGNSAGYSGGGCLFVSSSVVINNCMISGNSAISMSGGGVCCSSSSLAITNCTISENSSYFGGGFFGSNSQMDITNCTISYNTAEYGAGMDSDTTSPIITNCTIFMNSATYSGGGFYCYYSSPIITNSSFYGNSATTGGAIYCSVSSSPTITNSILWNDSPQEIYGSPTVTYSDIQGGYSGAGNINENPLFIDPNAGDFHLQADSNCIDNADPNALGLPLTDKDGNPRIVNGNPDMGVYEFLISYVSPGSSIQQAINNAVDGSVIILTPGIYYEEDISFNGKAIIIRSTNPDDPNVVANTMIDGNIIDNSLFIFGNDPNNPEGPSSVLSGLTLQRAGSLNSPADYGAICCKEFSSPSIINCVIKDNYSDISGGGIACIKASPIITNCTIIDNYSYGQGGGIYCIGMDPNIFHSAPIISNCTLINNVSIEGGGGMHFYRTSPHIINCIVAYNSTYNDGGGIYISYGSYGKYWPSGLKSLISFCTITGNKTKGSFGNGDGIYLKTYWEESYKRWIPNPFHPTVIDHCIIWNNKKSDTHHEEIYGSLPQITSCDIQGGWSWADPNSIINADPLFLDPDPNSPDYHVDANSPCINAGDSFGLAYPSTDKDGNPRPLDVKYDMGAYEYLGSLINVPGDYSTIQGAINAANDHDVIIVQQGTYTENINLNGKAITLASTNPSDPEVVANTIIDGNQVSTVVTFNNGEGSNTALSGFTVKNGQAQYGGGIFCDTNSSPSIDNCIITENLNNSNGGGIYCRNGASPLITNCTITGNSAGLAGGIYCRDGASPLITNCTITGNSANGFGGGFLFYNDFTSPSLTNCTITGNSANTYGGGIFCFNNASFDATNCTISGNSANYGAGIYSYYQFSLDLTSCEIAENSATNDGGGIYCDYCTIAKITNCVIARNSTVDEGGGILLASVSPEITNCTITGNSASDDGGGIFCKYSSPVLTNCILWDDSPEEVYLHSGSPSITYSDIDQEGYSDPNLHNISEDPLFVIQDGGNYHLQASSPCINAGTIAGVPYSDKDGRLRPFHPGSGCDMGAYEYTNLMVREVPKYYSTIQGAIDASNDWDTIIVEPGTYKENIDFKGKAITIKSKYLDFYDPNILDDTIIDGNQQDSVVVCENGEGKYSQLIGFTLQNGRAINGGCIYCDTNSSPSIISCNIIGNSATFMGGGIFCFNASPEIIQCNITENTAMYGGGIFSQNSSARIIGCTITENSAQYGGAIYSYNSSPSLTINSCTITENSATYYYGSGIYCNSSSPEITNSIFWDNPGYSIYTYNSDPIITYSDIEDGYGDPNITHNIDSDPDFVDPNLGDYRLNANSPCINAGNDIDPLYLSTDKNNVPRPIGSRYDMGAFEFCYYGLLVPDFSSLPFTEIVSIQDAINLTSDWDFIRVFPGTYKENIDFKGKAVTLMSMDPWNSKMVAETIIDGNQQDSVVVFQNEEGENSVIRGFTIRNGKASNGGGIYCDANSSPGITNCVISSNEAEYGGGIYCDTNSSPSITNCTINNNKAPSHAGGGIYSNANSAPNIINCIISGNTTAWGGGIYSYTGSSPRITNCTITENTASSQGGGIRAYQSSSTVTNCILWNDTPQEIYIYGGTQTVTYSDIEGGYGDPNTTHNIDSDPNFVDPNSEDFHLQAGSPCIDYGTDTGTLSYDKEGVTRPQDGDGINGAQWDMGAYEYSIIP